MMKQIFHELKNHAPFTAFGALTGIGIMIALLSANNFLQIQNISYHIFFILHPFHVVLSAVVTTGIYKLHKPECSIIKAIAIGYFGSIGIATLSDSIVPYIGELLLELPNPGSHIGLIEEPLVTNFAAFLGIAIGLLRSRTKISHTVHVLISTWASLFHTIMAINQQVNSAVIFLIVVFLFLAVWLPCCLSDIVFPLLFVSGENAKNI